LQIDRDLVYREGERCKARAEISDVDVPDTIQGLVLARVDRGAAAGGHLRRCRSSTMSPHRLYLPARRLRQNANLFLREP
jgi:hypothetical protein